MLYSQHREDPNEPARWEINNRGVERSQDEGKNVLSLAERRRDTTPRLYLFFEVMLRKSGISKLFITYISILTYIYLTYYTIYRAVIGGIANEDRPQNIAFILKIYPKN